MPSDLPDGFDGWPADAKRAYFDDTLTKTAAMREIGREVGFEYEYRSGATFSKREIVEILSHLKGWDT